MIRVDAHEVTDLGRDLDRAAGTVGPKVSAAVRRTAFAIEGTAKAAAPVDTGHLKNSISTDITGGASATSIAAEVGPTAEYGIYVELGTRNMSPQPYLGPAFDRHVDGFTRVMGDIGAKIL